MRLHVASKDEHIRQLCREVVAELLGADSTLHLTTECVQECDADLYVWDTENEFHSVAAIEVAEKWRHFFLVDRANIQQFRAQLSFQDANILLKPVTKATLAAFFSDACARSQAPAGAANDSFIKALRADRDEILQCLIQTNLKLQEYDHDRTNFLARAIHDFRAPLTAITGYCGLLLGDDLGNLSAQQRDVVQRMHTSAKKLCRMASAMFQLSIAPRVEVALDLRHRELRDCVHQALNEILPSGDEKRIAIEVDLEQPARPLAFEPSKIEQLLINLLDNACKFTPRAGRIQIKGYDYFWDRRMSSVDRSGGGAERRYVDDHTSNAYRIDICDSGPGIPEAHLSKIFEEYTSYGGGSDRSGGGLGLAICRMIIQQHHGKIWAENRGSGAAFSFVLPFEKRTSVPVEHGSRAKIAI